MGAGVADGGNVGVCVGVKVGVSVGVLVGVNVKVGVGEEVKVAVDVGEEVTVGVLEGVGLATSACAQALLSIRTGRSQGQPMVPKNMIKSIIAVAAPVKYRNVLGEPVFEVSVGREGLTRKGWVVPVLAARIWLLRRRCAAQCIP